MSINFYQISEYLQFIAGLGLGAFTSWIISHEYYRKSNTQSEVEWEDCIITRQIDEVWKLLTYRENIHLLDWRYPSLIVGETLQYGVEIGCGPIGRSVRRLYIVDINPPFDLSWGLNPTDWDTTLSLRHHPDGTRLIFTRKLWQEVGPWWVVILARFFHDLQNKSVHKDLIRGDIDRILQLFR